MSIEQLHETIESVSDPENRESIKKQFQEAVETTLKDFSDQTGDSNFDFEELNVPHKLDPPAMFVMAKISSKKVEQFNVSWIPSNKVFCRTILMVRDQFLGQGIASIMNTVTEEIAKKLGCKSLEIQAIVDKSVDYWRNKPDYRFDETKNSATKYF